VQGKIINGLVAGGTLGGWAGVKPLNSDHPLYSATLHPLSTDGRAVATAPTLTIINIVHSHIPLVTAPGTPLWPHGNLVNFAGIRAALQDQPPLEAPYTNTAFVIHNAAHIVQKETEEALASAVLLSEKTNPCLDENAAIKLVQDYSLEKIPQDMSEIIEEVVMLRCLDSLRFLAKALDARYPDLSALHWLSPPHLVIARHPIASAFFKMDLETVDALLALGVDINARCHECHLAA
jgi:hypothetical protein